MNKNIQYTILTRTKTRIRQRTGGSKMVENHRKRRDFVGKHDILGKQLMEELQRYLRGTTQATEIEKANSQTEHTCYVQ